MPTLSRSRCLTLVAAGIRAPSADNVHHVRFAIRDDALVVYADDFFLRDVAPHRRLLTLISFGAVAENLRLKLTEQGWTFQPRWFPERDDPAVLLRIDGRELEPATADPLAARIDSRHTNRRFYRRTKMTEAQARDLATAVASVPHAALAWCDDAARRRTLLGLMRLAETARFGSEGLHREMFDSIDFARGWHETAEERLAPATLEVEPFLRMPFAALRDWRVMRAANRAGMHRMLGLRAGDLPARLSPHLGVLHSSLAPEDAALAIGAAFQRLWLAADAAGLALQPMVAAAILAMQDDRTDPNRRVREALAAGWRPLLGDSRPLVVFRLGRAARPRVVAGRRPAESYLV